MRKARGPYKRKPGIAKSRIKPKPKRKPMAKSTKFEIDEPETESAQAPQTEAQKELAAKQQELKEREEKETALTPAERLLVALEHAHNNASGVTPWMIETCREIAAESAP